MINQERIASLDIARGLAVVMVVLLHASEVAGASRAIGSVNEVFAGIRMPLLFLISGFLTASLMGSGQRLITRTTQFLWLFSLWSVVGWIAAAALSHAMPAPAALVQEFARPTTTLWFVWALALMTASLPLLRPIPRPIQLIVGAAVSMAVYAKLFETSIYTYDHLLRQGVFFYLGVYGAAPLARLLRRPLMPALTIAVVSLLVLRLVDAHFVATSGWRVLTLPERFAASMATLYAAGCVARVDVMRRPFAWLGRNTLPIFVGHGLFLMLADTLFDFSGARSSARVLLLTVGAIGGALCLRAVLVRFGFRWMYSLPEALRTKTGGVVASQAVGAVPPSESGAIAASR